MPGALRAVFATLLGLLLVVAVGGGPSAVLPASYVASTVPSPVGSDSYVAFPSTTLGNDGTIEALDSMNGAVVGSSLTVGVNPGAIAVDPTTNQLVVANSGDSVHTATTASIVALTGSSAWSVTSTVSGLPTGAKPAAAMDTREGLALVVDEAADDVSVISMGASPSLVGNLSLGISGGDPNSIALSPDGLYAVITVPGSSELVELSYNGVAGDDDFTIATTYTGTSFTPDAVAIAGDGNLAYVTNDSTDVIDKIDVSPTNFVVQASSISLSSSPSTITAAADGNLYVSLPFADEVAFVNMNESSSPVVSDTTVSSAPGPLALNADDSILEMASDSTCAVQLLDTATAANAETASSLSNTPSAIATYPSDQERFFAYVANSGSGTVSLVDTITDSVVTTLTVGSDPDAIAVEPDDSAVFVANQGSNTISVIDPADIWSSTNPVVATITTSSGLSSGADPDALVLTPSGDDLLVAEYGKGQVQVVDTDPNDASYLSVVSGSSPIDLNGSGSSSSIEPTAIGMAPTGQYAWVVDNGADGVTTLEQSSAAGGYAFQAEQTTALGMTAPYGIAVAPNGANLYVTDDRGTSAGYLWDWPVTASGSSIGEPEASGGSHVTVGHTPAQVALSTEGQTAYVSNSGSGGGVSVVNAASLSVSTTSSLSGAFGGAVTPDGSLYLASSDASSGSVSVFDAATNGSVASVSVGSDPVAIAFGGQFSSPGPTQPVPQSDLAGGADNPSEAWQGSGNGFQQTSSSTAFSDGVDPTTGAYDLTIPVFSIPDVGPSLDLRLTYDSNNAAALGAMGDGWSFSYGMTLSGPTYSSATHLCTITVTQEDSSTVSFVKGSSGSCPTTGYVAASPAEQATLGHVTSCVGSDACYVLTRSDGTKYKLDATTDQLAYVVDPDGNTVTLADYGSGLLDTVTAQGGRKLTFSWSGGLVSQVVDDLGRKIAFTYSSDELTEITLTATADPTTHYFQFSYNSGTPSLKDWWSPLNDPTGSSPSSAEETAVSYNTAGQVDEVTQPQRSCVETSSTVNCNPETTFSWPSWDATSGTGAVLISDPNENAGLTNGNVTLDTYADHVLVSQVRGYGPGLPSTDASVMTATVRSPATLLPVETIDGNGNVTSSLFDGNGMSLVTIDPLGRTTTTEYNGYGETVASIDAMGNETQHVYDSYNDNDSGFDLYETIDPLGNVAYANFSGGNDKPFSAKDANTYTTDYTYDANGDLTETVDPAGDTSETLFDAVGEQCAALSAVEEAGSHTLPGSCPSGGALHYTSYVGYDFFGQSLEKITPSSAAGGTTTYGFDPDGNETSVEDPDSQTTSYSFNADDEQTEQVLPTVTAGPPTTTYAYDPDGNQVTMTKPIGNVSGCGCAAAHTWTTAFDNLGRQLSVTDPQSNATSYTYDGDGNELTLTPPATTHSQQTTNTYDADNELLTSTNALGDESSYGYNADGERDCASDPNAASLGDTCPADPTSRVADTTTTTYTADGKTATTEDPLGNVTTYYYDADNNEVAYTEPEGDPATCNPLTTSHCAYTYYLTYNDDDQMSSMTTPPTATSSTGQTTDYTYTHDGDAYQTTDPLGQVTTDAYDELDRLTSVSYSSVVNTTHNVTYSYTNEGKPYQMTDGSGTTTDTYDADQQTTEIENGAGAVLTFTYDLDGNNTCIAYSISSTYSCSSSPGSSNHVVDYTYDHDDRMSTITDWTGDTLTYTYNHDSVPQELSANSGAVTENWSYDAGGNTSEVDTTAGSSTLLELAYSYDNDGNPTKETPTIGTTTQTVENFTVDAADRVHIFWTGTGGAPSANLNYGNDGEIAQNGTVSASQGMAYDEAGELCWAYTSTSSNTCSSPPSGSTTYAYDADGERMGVTPSSGSDQSYD